MEHKNGSKTSFYLPRNNGASPFSKKVFDFLIDEGRIDRETAAMIKSWRHTGFSVDNSVRIEADDYDGMQRLIEYVCHCYYKRLLQAVR
ncbi:MAG: hypothetical protein JXA18_07705 [Chitinispirillaceae bacterium]|nr:hypothetical protein [Chitinispirillaceae bacterium]